MRTTVTLDSDVEAMVKKVMTERGVSFKEAINTSLRRGLTSSAPADITFPAFDMGVAKVDIVHAVRLAADLEDEEILRDLSSGR